MQIFRAVPNEEDVTGVQIIPRNWPRKVQIACKDETAKNNILINGLDMYGLHIDLYESNTDVKRIIMDDAPLTLSDEDIKMLMAQYGTVVRIQHERLRVNGKLTSWVTGTRWIFMNNTSDIPAVISIQHEGKSHNVHIKYNGQPEVLCRWCKETHLREDIGNCPKKPSPKCFNCGSKKHMKNDCEFETRVCYNCQSPTHESRDCTRMPAANISFSDTAKVLVLGDSNCRNLQLRSKRLPVEQELVVVGGTRAKDISTRISENQHLKRDCFDAIVVHAGSADFHGAETRKVNVDMLFTQYTSSLTDVAQAFPSKPILLSTIPPRMGSHMENVNKQIDGLNSQLRYLTEMEDNITLIDNDLILTNERGEVDTSLYRDHDSTGIHFSEKGKRMLGAHISECVSRVVLDRRSLKMADKSK